ncbi:hypothetical protein FHS18_002803 [Paenibacillus phyllosphaerae]|uniref:Uncharacterized protein n=1 Tax=Paenibacillus phyllosphaerae TaxID=274593 RepID=A0A7W5AZ23_9BACL|nr:hypothetical protein [Paenibacillus phyllosphaerae]MBB3110736.1 hypothetical protein [Paenibacillus phyllosphaerae]
MIKGMLWLLFLLPWVSLFLARRGSIKRYMPVVVFTCFVMTIIFMIAYRYQWWEIHEYIVPWGNQIDISFAYGIFAVGTFWIFYFTAERFWIYCLANIATDALFSFAIFPLLARTGVATLHNIKAWQYYFVILGVSLLIYGYYRWQAAAMKEPNDQIRLPYSENSTFSIPSRSRHKAR